MAKENNCTEAVKAQTFQSSTVFFALASLISLLSLV